MLYKSTGWKTRISRHGRFLPFI